MVHFVSGWTQGVQVKLWDPLRTRAILERLKGVFTTRRYTNSRLPYLTLPYLVRWAGKAKAGMVHSGSEWTRGVRVKLWDPLRTRAIPEHLKGVFTTRCYTNQRLPLPLHKIQHRTVLIIFPALLQTIITAQMCSTERNVIVAYRGHGRK